MLEHRNGEVWTAFNNTLPNLKQHRDPTPLSQMSWKEFYELEFGTPAKSPDEIKTTKGEGMSDITAPILTAGNPIVLGTILQTLIVPPNAERNKAAIGFAGFIPGKKS